MIYQVKQQSGPYCMRCATAVGEKTSSISSTEAATGLHSRTRLGPAPGSLARALSVTRREWRGAARRRFTPEPACEGRNGGWERRGDAIEIGVALPSLGSPIREALDQAFGDERFIMMFGFAALSEETFASTTLEAQTQVGYGT
jgi:hypothetical protein